VFCRSPGTGFRPRNAVACHACGQVHKGPSLGKCTNSLRFLIRRLLMGLTAERGRRAYLRMADGLSGNRLTCFPDWRS
jgi:hypothetical protein